MIYKGKYTNEISFPLGGIGSGSVGLTGNGVLRDFEIFNKPAKGSYMGYTHFAVKAKTKNGVITKVLNGDRNTQLSPLNGTGVEGSAMSGFPHFKNHIFKGEFPVAEILFSDDNFPAHIKLSAFNPFIPLDEDNSSIPAAFFEIEITNKSDEEIEFQTAFSLQNPYDDGVNEASVTEGVRILTLKSKLPPEPDQNRGDISVITDSDNSFSQTYWYRGGWQDGIVTFWNNFNSETDAEERIYDCVRGQEHPCRDHGSLFAKRVIKSGESKTVRYILTWNNPVNRSYGHFGKENENGSKIWFKNYYAVLWKDSVESALYSFKNYDTLKAKTLAFKEALFSQSLDKSVIDAVSSTLSVLKSPTVLRFEDGSFHGWEGVFSSKGSCEGTCQHVYNYAYALCFLFPNLERGLRHNEFVYSTEDSGLSHFRMLLPLGISKGYTRPCLDGKMGMVIKSYREWKISGDDNWLKEHWEYIKRAVDFARSKENYDKWDFDGDGVLEGRQHHTLDMELFGPSSWLEGMYLAALKAAGEMAEYLGDYKAKKTYNKLFKNGKKWSEENLFNGRYFIQKIDLKDKETVMRFDAKKYWNEETGEIKYQIGEGSSIDQLLGQWHADLLSLGDLFSKKQIKTALSSMMEINFIPSLREFANPWRVFALNDEGGTVICNYHKDSQKPLIPVPYCEELMTGFEYSFAGELIMRGKVQDGLKVIKAIRNRYDGFKRNPYNEIECGNNYVRPLASFALINAFSGFDFHLPKGYIKFAPKVKKNNFKCIWSLGTGWGEFLKNENTATLKVKDGSIKLSAFGSSLKNVKEVYIDSKKVDFTEKNGFVYFKETEIKEGITIK